MYRFVLGGILKRVFRLECGPFLCFLASTVDVDKVGNLTSVSSVQYFISCADEEGKIPSEAKS